MSQWSQLSALAFLSVLCAVVQSAPKKGNVEQWTVDEVCQWAEGQGFKGTADGLRLHEVDGVVLLHIEEKDLEEELNMNSSIARKKFMVKVDDLRRKFKGKALPDRDFWQYRALNRKRTDVATMMLNGTPRLAFLWMLEEPDVGPIVHDSPLKWVFPHLLIFFHRSDVMEGLPWLLGWGHLVMGILEPIIVVYACLLYGSGKTTERSTAVRVFAGPVVVMMYSALGYWLLYPVIPWVLCDVSFYLSMLHCWWHGVSTLLGMAAKDMQDGVWL